jgi:hypothetical protein
MADTRRASTRWRTLAELSPVAGDVRWQGQSASRRLAYAPEVPGEELVADLRRFILTYGDHDADCPGNRATGAAVADPDLCSCGFIARMDELLTEVARRTREEHQ